MEGDIITMQELFTFDHSPGLDENGRSLGQLKPRGLRPQFLEKLHENGVPIDPRLFALERFVR
jgi:pilus assembly protein CpaF